MKITGLKGRSPETYANPRTSGDVQTISDVDQAGVVNLSNSGFVDLIAPQALPGGGGFRAIITYSGVLENPAPGSVTVEVKIEAAHETYTRLIEVTATNSPVSFSMVFETGFLVPIIPGVFVQAMTTTPGDTANSTDASIVIIVTPT